jgi:hypothetical protein
MIKPNYVTYEVAKLLKEKGCLETNKMRFHFLSNLMTHLPYPGKKEVIYALEHWQVIEWLRLNHNIWIQPVYQINGYWGFDIQKLDIERILNGAVHSFMVKCNSPKEACDEAFLHVLTKVI